MPEALAKILEKAVEHHRRGALDAATQLYRLVLQVHPDHPEALHLLGVVRQQQGKPQEAIRLIHRALAIRPDNPVYLLNLGEALYNAGEYDAAATTLQRALALGAVSASAWNRLGLIAHKYRHDREKARRAYAAALAENHDHIPTLNNLGLLLLADGCYDEAAILFQRVTTLDPCHAGAYCNLALTNQHRGRDAEALADFRRALALDADRPGVRRQYIRLLQNTCSWKELEEELQRLARRTNRELAAEKIPEESPFLHLTRSFSSRQNLAVAQAWSRQLRATNLNPDRSPFHAHD